MDNVILLSMPGGPELLVIFLIVLLLFGAKRIPEVAQNLGKGIREFKKSMREVQSEIDTAVDTPKPKVETPKAEDKTKLDNKNE
jgi:sec-independent protein translocase protein TatA